MRSIHTTKQENHHKNNAPYRVIHQHRTKLGNPIRGIIILVIPIISLLLLSILLASSNDTYADGSISFSVDNSDTVLELTVPESINLNLTPNSANNYVAFGTKSFIVGVGTNNPTGYTLSMTSDTVLTNDSITMTEHPTGITFDTDNHPTIESITSTYTESAFETGTDTINKWGYKAPGRTSYIAVPSSIPELSKTEASSNAITSPSDPDAIVLTFATKVDATQPAGTYTATLNFVAVTNTIPVYEKEIIGLGTIQYDPGMTWGEWIESEYNTYGLGVKQLNFVGQGDNVYSPLYDDGTTFPVYGAEYANPNIRNVQSSFISDVNNSSDYSGFCIWRLESLSWFAMYDWFSPDQPIDFAFEHWEDGETTTMSTTYVYADYARDVTVTLFTEDYSMATEFSIYKLTTWSEYIDENPTAWLSDTESGDSYEYFIIIADDKIIFIDDLGAPNKSYMLSDVSPDDAIIGGEYTLVDISNS